MEQQYRDAWEGARGGGVRGGEVRTDGVRAGGVRRAARGRGFGGAGLVAAVAAGCAVTVLATDPVWALRRPEPRPAVEVVAAGAPSPSTLPAPATPTASTLPAPAKPGAGSGAGSTAGSGTAEAAARPSDSDLEVVRIDPDAAAPGGTTTIHAFVGNGGPETTASPFTVAITLPEGVSPEGPFFPSTCQVVSRGRVVRCVFAPGLREGRSATALIPVRLAPDLPEGRLSGGSVAVRSADDRYEGNNRQPFDITVAGTAAGS
ncbi:MULTISPECIES: hypothetical protein [Streptomycetaceae]|uniref:hypothetical protein n=1 Tax=Streptomycetaceae TaxID=2062 RepID=UPI0011610754|nr:hypothetical protein [Streptomyces sp. CB02056]